MYHAINCCIFDMGGVLVRDYQIVQQLLPFLGFTEKSFSEIDERLQEAMHRHSIGEIGEEHFWFLYRMITGRAVLPGESLLGKFFHPKINETVLQVLAELKASGIRTICATNVIDAHYRIHHKLNQYAVFDRVYASHLMGVAKPDPAFFSYILGAERINASEAFFTDDTAVNVDAARNAGLNAFVFTDAASLRKQLQLFGLPDKGEPGKL